MMDGLHVALGVSGSIAAVKTVELAHELRRQGARVRAVMTESAADIIHPWALEFATERDVITEITGAVEHVELCGREGWADVLLLAPSTANTVGKIAHAVDDTTVTTCATTALGAGCPVVMAPAMHEPMYDHPGVIDSLGRLDEWGIRMVDPRLEEGKAKIAKVETIVREVAREATASPLGGRTVVVTSGATSEPLDPVRSLTTGSSGRTGRAIAEACYVAGAEVMVVHDGPALSYGRTEQVTTAAEMLQVVEQVASEADALVSAAAIGDFTLAQRQSKIPSGEPMTLELDPTPKLLDEVRASNPALAIVGFKAEVDLPTDQLVANARAQLERIDGTFVVANDAAVMGESETACLLVTPDEVRQFEGSKVELGRLVATTLAGELDG